jgi:hypothetical protein
MNKLIETERMAGSLSRKMPSMLCVLMLISRYVFYKILVRWETRINFLKAYTLKLIKATSCAKTGEGLCEQFEAIVDQIELQHDCIVIYFTTDSDGGSKKGRVLLEKKRPWMLTPSCWGHQVRIQTILIVSMLITAL